MMNVIEIVIINISHISECHLHSLHFGSKTVIVFHHFQPLINEENKLGQRMTLANRPYTTITVDNKNNLIYIMKWDISWDG